MLPRSYDADVRGFRKKNRPWKLLHTYSPAGAVGLLITVLILTVLLINGSRSSTRLGQTLQATVKSKDLENRNLLASLQQERQSRINAENTLRESNTLVASLKRQLSEAKSSHSTVETHSKALHESYERTRQHLLTERDSARAELSTAQDQILQMNNELRNKDHSLLAQQQALSRKQEVHADKEKAWLQMRHELEEQIRKQGGFVASHASAPGDNPPQQHPDYAAAEGRSAFHFNSDGHRERFIDTAKVLVEVGVVDPQGIEHLAQLLGHLFDLKQEEYDTIQKSYPATSPPPKPPIGHWMALNLERMGIKSPQGVMHLAYLLDGHFALKSTSDMVGRANEDYSASSGQVHHDGPWKGTPTDKPTLNLPPTEPGAGGAPLNQEAEGFAEAPRQPRLHRSHHVDAAGFV